MHKQNRVERGWMQLSHSPREIGKNVAMPSCPRLVTSTNVPQAEVAWSARCWRCVSIVQVEVEGAEGYSRVQREGAVRSGFKIRKRQKSAEGRKD